MDDTTPEIAEMMREMIRMKSPTERVKMGCSMYETSKHLIIRAILENNPGISEVGLRQELFLRFYGNDFNPIEREKILKHLERC
jgi:hypothetical protein